MTRPAHSFRGWGHSGVSPYLIARPGVTAKIAIESAMNEVSSASPSRPRPLPPQSSHQGIPVDESLRLQRSGRPRRAAAATIGVPHQATSSPPPRSIAGGRKSNVIRTDRPKRRRPLREHLSVELRMSRFPRGPSTDDGRRHRRRDDFI